MTERPLFRRYKNIVRGIQISEEEVLANTTLRPQTIDLGSITGMELPTGPYTFRRGNGHALDNSSEWTWVVRWKEKWLTAVQVRSQMRNGISSYNIPAPPFSRRTTSQDICLTHRLPTAAWSHRPHWCEQPVGWVAQLTLDGREGSTLHNRERLTATQRWGFFIGGRSRCCKSFKSRND